MKGLRLALMLCAVAGPGGAENWVAADPQERCAICHGYFGNTPRSKFPKLAGQRPEYLTAQIQAFLTGWRSNDGGQMAKTVTELAPEEIPVVVAWFASQDPPTPTQPEDPSVAEQGPMIWAASGCGTCHDSQNVDEKDAPLLSAQHPAYLAKQMHDFQSGDRVLADAAKRRAIAPLTETEIASLAAWLGATPRETQ